MSQYPNCNAEALSQRVKAFVLEEVGRNMNIRIKPEVVQALICEFEKQVMQVISDRVGHNQIAMGKLLGLNRNTIRRRVKDLGIDPQRDHDRFYGAGRN